MSGVVDSIFGDMSFLLTSCPQNCAAEVSRYYDETIIAIRFIMLDLRNSGRWKAVS